MLSIRAFKPVFQLATGWLNAVASENMLAMVVTLDVEKWSYDAVGGGGSARSREFKVSRTKETERASREAHSPQAD
jgi:hypothetical protein